MPDARPNLHAEAGGSASFFSSEAFRQSRPILLTVFTNKVGSIGLSLIAILLVNKGVTTAQGTLVLSALKAMILAGTLIGGALSDRFGARGLVLAAFALSAAALGFLPFQRSIVLILIFGLMAQFADSLLMVAQRMLILGHVERPHQKEALGWMRMVNNSASIFSYALAAAGSRLGIAPLMLFDASTSCVAFFVGREILPDNPSGGGSDRAGAPRETPAGASRTAFFSLAAALLGWTMLYELFLQGGAGRLEMLYPGEGLRRFSSMMILNTVVCAALSVRASRLFENSLTAIVNGIALTGLGLLTMTWGMGAQAYVFLGMLLLTLGEVMLGAVAQYAMIRLAPGGDNSGFYYSTGLTLMQCGRILGAAAAFPLLIHARGLGTFTALVAGTLALMLGILYTQRERLSRV